jgi:hypothetical protein
MKNIQIIDGADNATFSIFQATDEEFAAIFPRAGQDLEVIEELIDRLGEEVAKLMLTPLWERPVSKRDVQGIHGTLFYGYQSKAKYLPSSRREMDRAAGQLNEWQRRLYDRLRKDSQK